MEPNGYPKFQGRNEVAERIPENLLLKLVDLTMDPGDDSPAPRRKSSLKRSSSIGVDDSRSLTPERRNVHFADSDGLQLVDVRSFPPSHSDLRLFDSVLSPVPSLTTIMPVPSVPPLMTKSADIGSCWRPFYSLPTIMTDIFNMVVDRKVCFETIVPTVSKVEGTLIVCNLDYQKDVFVRVTFNRWETYEDVAARYEFGSTLAGMDKFVFTFSIPENTIVIEMAACYKTLNREFWDNNWSLNYRLQLVEK